MRPFSSLGTSEKTAFHYVTQISSPAENVFRRIRVGGFVFQNFHPSKPMLIVRLSGETNIIALG